MDSDHDPRIRNTYLRIRLQILLCLSVADRKPTKNKFFQSFIAYCFLKVHLYQSFKDKKSKKKSQISKNQGFSYFFSLLMEGSGTVQIMNGSLSYGSGYGSTTLEYENRGTGHENISDHALWQGGDRASSGFSEACDALTVSAQT
jgi:hypothetical protein